MIGFVMLYVASFVLASSYILEDAENFSHTFNMNEKMRKSDIEQNYLNIGTQGIDIFTPYRIKNADNLVDKINNNKAAYNKAINLCLPAARKISEQANNMLNKVQTLLDEKESAPVYILFGANNSGGTATKDGIVLGLEVLCRFAENEEDAKEIILSFIAHEVVHVYQSRIRLSLQNNSGDSSESSEESEKTTLLKQSLLEGVADYVAFLALGKIVTSEIKRHEYGVKNEAKTWSEFKIGMHNSELGDWIYNQSKASKPNDMGYWVGKRIAQAYYDNSEDKTKALRELLLLQDPVAILEKSGYSPK